MGILGNDFWSGDMGIVDISSNGVSFGKTTGGCTASMTENFKEIMKDQNGSVRYDEICTGVMYQVKATFSDLNVDLYEKLCSHFKKTLHGNKLVRKLWRSSKDNSIPITITKYTDDSVTLSTDPNQKLHIYKATPKITGDFYQSGPDVQKTLEVTFDIWYDEVRKSHAYSGIESSS